MVIDRITKSLKSCNKRKNKITLGIVVAFLLGSLSVYGEITVKYENSEIRFYQNEKLMSEDDIKKLGTFEKITGEDSVSFIWNIDGEISEQIKIALDNKKIENITFDIINDGKILADLENGNAKGKENGIYIISSKISKLINNNLISVDLTTGGNKATGNGIYNSSSTIEILENNGVVFAKNSWRGDSGNGILNVYSTIKNLENNGVISGRNNNQGYSGNGIYHSGQSSIIDLKNNGIFSGNANNGQMAGNGIFFNDRASIVNLKNNGIFSGNANNGQMAGNGICLNTVTSIKILENSGIISGNNKNSLGYGVYNKQNGKIENFTNYGIISGTEQAIGGDINNIKNQKNYGILIDKAGKQEQSIKAGADGEVTADNENRFVINGVKNIQTDGTAESDFINSSDLKNKISEDKITAETKENYFDEKENRYKNLVINVVGDNDNSLNIDEDFNISKSIINGYNTAVILNGGDFTGEDVTVNSRGNAFIGNGKDISDISLTNSTVNGNIETNGTIKLGSTIVNGDIVITNGGIDLSYNSDELSKVNGTITMKGDIITVYLNRDETFVNDKIITIEDDIAEQILGLSYELENLADSEDMKKQISQMKDLNSTSNFKNFETVKLSDEGNSYVDLRGITEINSVMGGKGDDRFVISSSELKNIFIDGEENKNGGDSLKLTDKINGSVANLDQIKNIENLELANGGNLLNISTLGDTFLSVTGGAGKDEFIISENDISKNIFINDTNENDGDILKLTFKINEKEKNITDISSGIENLQLNDEKNKINIDKFAGNFSSVTGGKENDKFITGNLGDVILDGGEGEKDRLKITQGINNIENPEIFDKISNFENLALADSGNTVDIDSLSKTNNNFTKITGGAGTDYFKISVENLKNLISLDGKGAVYGDTLEISSGDISNSSILEKAKNIGNLLLAENSSNDINLDNLSFISITARGEGNDKFSVKNNVDKLKIEINGGNGNDSFVIENSQPVNNISDKEVLKNIKGIEKLEINNSGNNQLSFDKENINDFDEVNISGDGNEISLNNIGELETNPEKVSVKFGENKTDNIVTVADSDGIFKHQITNASKIILDGDNKVWKFGEGSKIGNSNNTVLNLNKNILELSEKFSLGTDGKLSFGNINFVSNGKVTLENGRIKVEFSDDVIFKEGIDTKFSLSDGDKILFGKGVELETYAFLNSSYDSTGKKFNITVKSWNELLNKTTVTTEEDKLFADTYNYILKEYYNNQDKDKDKTITNAFNTFGTDAIAEYIKNVKNYGLTKELILNSESGEFKSTVSGKVFVRTDENFIGESRNSNLTFKDISTNNFEINTAEGTENNISFTGAVILKEGIKVAENSLGKINISLKEKSSIELGNIDFGTVKGTLNIEDTSVIKSLGTITNGDITVGRADTDGFNKVLVSSNDGVENITVASAAENLEIKNNYSGALNFTEENSSVTLLSEYSGQINFEGNKNILTVGEKGNLVKGIKFEDNSYGNKITVSENGNIGKNIIFGTSYAGREKENLDEFNLTSKDGKFTYNVENADEINLSGENFTGTWNFADGKISGNNVIVNVNNGMIEFKVQREEDNLKLAENSLNPFENTGTYNINGKIKIDFDMEFGSLSDKLNVGNTNILSADKNNIIIPKFLNYDSSKKEFSIKSADELGINKIGYGNYEYAILNYNGGKGYEVTTDILRNGTAEEIKNYMNNGIAGDFYFYSDKENYNEDDYTPNKLFLGNLFIGTSKDTEKIGTDTNISFENIAVAKKLEINVNADTENNISLIGDVNIGEGIDGSKSEGIINLSLGGGTINLYDKAVILGRNDDTLNILSSASGIFDGADGENILNIGETTEKISDGSSKNIIELNGTIKNFEEINLNQDIKLNSDLKFADKNPDEKVFTETERIKLNGNNLILGVDYSKVSDDKVIGHALYNSGITVNNETGKIMIETAGAGNGTIISLGTDNKSKFEKTDREHLIESGSSAHYIEMTENGEIIVKILEHILGGELTGGAIKYAHLDKIYQSIVSAGKLETEMKNSIDLTNKTGTLEEQKAEAVKAQLEFYGKIYHSTPYAYSNDVSKKSADLITESILNLNIMPECKEWVFGGSIAGRESDSDGNFYGSNYYTGIDIGKNEVSADTNIYGAYAFGKYGVGENKSLGFAVAGTRSDTDISGNSKLEGDAVYISAFAEQEINNLKLVAGISYQHSFYDAERNVSNDYQSMKAEKDYEDDLISIYAGGKYSYSLGNNFFLEPNIKLSLTHVMQEGIDEGDNGGLTIKTEEKDFTFIESEIGLELVKKINLENGILNLKAGTSLVYSLGGYEEEYLTGKITGSSKSFEMISPEDDRSKMKFTVGAEYEMTNGMFMNLNGNYTTSSHTKDYTVSFGAGYKW